MEKNRIENDTMWMNQFERPSVTVDMMVIAMNQELNGLKILMVKRKDPPFLGQYSLPGGFIKIEESAYEAASRRLREETGLRDIYLEQVYTMSQPHRDPRGRVITIAYMALIPLTEQNSQLTEDADWFDLELTNDRMIFSHPNKEIKIEYELEKKNFQNGIVKVTNAVPRICSKESLAFDHEQIVYEGMMQIRRKIEYSDVAFNLVDKEFTLPDLQSVYEVILGKELYKTNFRAKLAEKVQSLEQKGVSITGRRKSTLYRYSPE